MTEVPEHLRKRAEEARAKAAAAKAAADAPADAPAEPLSAEQQEAASKIPPHLLERSKAAKAKVADGGDAVDADGKRFVLSSWMAMMPADSSFGRVAVVDWGLTPMG